MGARQGGREALSCELPEQLSDTDLAAVVTFERNAWGNKTGEVIQPAEIKPLRK